METYVSDPNLTQSYNKNIVSIRVNNNKYLWEFGNMGGKNRQNCLDYTSHRKNDAFTGTIFGTKTKVQGLKESRKNAALLSIKLKMWYLKNDQNN